MDKTIEVILVATVVLVTALAVLFIFQGRAFGFDSFLDNQSQGAECGLLKTQYQQACSCSESPPETDKASEIKSDARSKSCDWSTLPQNYACGADYCD